MTATAHPTTTAPPDDPVRVALEDATILGRVRNHARAVLRGRLVEADDVVQIVSARAWERRASFDPSTGSVTGWLFGIAQNVIREECRRRRPVPSDPAELSAAVSDDRDRETDLADLRFQVERHLERLPVEYQAAVTLRYVHDADYPEIAERLQVTPVNARMKVCRGLKLLREYAASNPKEDRS